MAACMNAVCCAAAPGGEWRKGWVLRSGGFAMLCDKCGTAYEQLIFCDLFHQKESGWRECVFCGKRLHCGCIASKSSIDLLDGGGVQCIGCMKNPKPSLCPRVVSSLSARSPKDENASEFGASLEGSTCKLESSFTDYKMDVDAIVKGKVVQLGMNNEDNGHITMFRAQKENYSSSGSFSHVNGEKAPHIGSPSFLKRDPDCVPSSHISQQDDSLDASKDSVICESLARAYLSISSGNPNPGASIEVISSGANPQVVPPLSNAVEGSDQNRTFSAFSQVQRTHHLLDKPQNSGLCSASEASKEVVSHVRVARPPGEGRGRNQLLPRYWPRFTGQELQKIYGDSNTTIVPLFEKVLSASDAGRIGRLVLPKACAEAYFPPISQPEGLPLTLQDSRGKNWHFQFRFWPNNNSRMYVLEGVTPCIQSLQLQAGDTVTFSRIEPEGKLVMGYRKATTSVTLQDSQISSTANGTLGSGNLFSTVNDNLSTVSGYSGLLQSLKGFANSNLSCLSERLNPADGDISWKKTDKQGGIPEAFVWQPSLVMEKKRSRNIGSKSKRLHIDKEDALELKLSWEEAQDLLRPPPSVKPSIVVIEDHEFEEYDEPPVFGKRVIYTTQPFGGQDQWIQCDDCFKWRRLSVDVLPPPKWTCSDNVSDPQRSLCSTPDELNPKDLQSLLRQDADRKRRKITGSSSTQIPRIEAYGLDALANAAALGDAENGTMATTKHPRHRPGCTCIVCIQPPSGKGPKHDPACTCNVCLTVKRRFKTLMMRKKQRQSEREEAEVNHKKPAWGEMETGGDFKIVQVDLNCQPGRVVGASSRVSMMSLLEVASRPLEDYLRQNGLSRLDEGGADEGSDTAGNDVA